MWVSACFGMNTILSWMKRINEIAGVDAGHRTLGTEAGRTHGVAGFTTTSDLRNAHATKVTSEIARALFNAVS